MKCLLTLLFIVLSLNLAAQTESSLPAGTVPYGNVYLDTGGNVWAGATGKTFKKLGLKTDVVWLSDSIADLRDSINGKADKSTILDINGVAQDISTSRTWTIPTVTSLSALMDVYLTTLSNNQLLKYDADSSKWTNWTPTFVSGSGTTSYIPYFSGGSMLANSIMQIFGNTIGFGMTPSGSPSISIEASGHIHTGGSMQATGIIASFNSMQSPYYSVRTGSFNGDIKSTNLTNSRVFELPNNSGTIALTSDISGFVLKAGDTMTGVLNGVGLVQTGTAGNVINSTATSGSAFNATATSGIGVESNVTTGRGISASVSGNGYAGYFTANHASASAITAINPLGTAISAQANSAGFAVSGYSSGDAGGGGFSAAGNQPGLVAVNSNGVTGYPGAIFQSYLGNPAEFNGTNSSGGSGRVAYFDNTGGLFMSGGSEAHNINLDLDGTTAGHKQGIVFKNGGIDRTAIKQEVMNYGSSLFDLVFYTGTSMSESGRFKADKSLVLSGALTGTSATFSGTSQTLLLGGSGTSALWTRFLNTGGDAFVGVEGSAGGTINTGSVAYSMQFRNSIGIGFSANNGSFTQTLMTQGGFLKASNDGTFVSSAGIFHELRTNQSGQNILQFSHTHATGAYGPFISFSGGSPNNTTNYFLGGGDATTTRFFIYSNGNIVNSNNSYGAISDIKVKENIVDMPSQTKNLMKIRLVDYNLIGDKSKKLQHGVIAQEIEKVYKDVVSTSPDLGKDGQPLGTETKSVAYSQLTPFIIKGFQEMMNKVEVLEAEVLILKSK